MIEGQFTTHLSQTGTIFEGPIPDGGETFVFRRDGGQASLDLLSAALCTLLFANEDKQWSGGPVHCMSSQPCAGDHRLVDCSQTRDYIRDSASRNPYPQLGREIESGIDRES